jgi:iron complex outermembrane receptor protein
MNHSLRKPLAAVFRRGASIALWGSLIIHWLVFTSVSAAMAEALPSDLTELSIEALMDIEITSLSKKSQKLSDAPAAVFVITQEDIRRSGVTSIPEALRMVPGLQAAKITANQWAITSRGFNGRFGNKLLVLMDGRSVYTPLFSGVFWEVQDTLLEDVDRIEVIRGPGGSIWGANAVNGVINIITKSAADTQGGLVVAGAGTEEKAFGSFRFGGTFKEDIHYRFFGKYFDRDEAVFADGSDAADGWDFLRGGFRVDAALESDNRFMLQGETYGGTTGDTVEIGTYTPPYAEFNDIEGDFDGSHLLGRWERDLGAGSDLGLQLYFDRAEWDSFVGGFRVDTYDVDFQHRFQLGRRQEIVWGLGYRLIQDTVRGSQIIQINPANDNQDLFSGFIQDEIALWEEAAYLTLGTKVIHNDFTGLEVQPNARLLFKADERNSVWLSVARAVRTPSRGETDSRVRDKVIPPMPPNPLAIQPVVVGNDDFETEELWAYEAGYRTQPLDTLSVDVALFYNDYDQLRTTEPQAPVLEFDPAPPHLIVPTLMGNDMKGHTYGIEVAADWQVSSFWRLQGYYSYLRSNLELESDDAPDQMITNTQDSSPRHQFSLQSSFNLPGNVELDLWGRYVDRLSAFDISSYVTIDARLAWAPVESLELALVGQNLLENRHPEFEPEFLGTVATEVQRSVYAKITWRF